jgi:hypothetical protein
MPEAYIRSYHILTVTCASVTCLRVDVVGRSLIGSSSAIVLISRSNYLIVGETKESYLYLRLYLRARVKITGLSLTLVSDLVMRPSNVVRGSFLSALVKGDNYGYRVIGSVEHVVKRSNSNALEATLVTSKEAPSIGVPIILG